MNPNFLALAAILCLAVAPSTLHAEPASVGDQAPPAVKVLTLGMTDSEVRKQLGRPAAIKPMKAPEGKAEVWTYRRPLATVVRQITPTTQRIPSAAAPGDCPHPEMAREPVYRTETIAVEEVTQLLFFNGTLQGSKRAKAEQRF